MDIKRHLSGRKYAGFIAIYTAILLVVFFSSRAVLAFDAAARWSHAWPDTDFSKSSVDLSEVMSGGPPRDGIPPIDAPTFQDLSAASLPDNEPVIGLHLGGEAKAYPLRILTWHEIVNDEIAGVPVAVTYCPLCNAAIVFDRRVDGQVLDFGTTGNLRNSDLIMWDRQTESWWQQFMGEAIAGEMTGTQLKVIPARLESFAAFKARTETGQVLIPNDPGMRSYGSNPYVGYDSAAVPFLYNGAFPEGIAPMERVVAVGEMAWGLPLLQEKGRVEAGDLILTWNPGQASALDRRSIADSRDVGNVIVQRKTASGMEDVAHDVTFAFVFHAFRPSGQIITD